MPNFSSDNGKIRLRGPGGQGGGVDVIDIYPGGLISAQDGSQSQVSPASLTDNSGGTPSDTIAAITAGAGYSQADATAIKNALASIAAKQNQIIAALKSVGILH